jgi:hypothetical protein
MEKGNLVKLQTFGLALIAAGFLVFIAVDMDLFKRIKASLSESKKSQEKEVSADIDKAKDNLNEIKNSVSQRREQIKKLITELKSIDKKIEIEERELKALSHKKDNFLSASSEKSRATPKDRNIVSSQTSSSLPDWKFSSWNEVIDKVQQISKQSSGVESREQTIAFFQEGIFSQTIPLMRPLGLRVAQAIAIGAKNLGVNSISVSFVENDIDSFERAKVASKYFRSILDENISVEIKNVEDSQIKSVDKVEFWVNLKSEERL